MRIIKYKVSLVISFGMIMLHSSTASAITLVNLGEATWNQGSVAKSINDKNEVVGYTIPCCGKDQVYGEPTSRAFVWRDGEFVTLPGLNNASDVTANDINNKSQIVGVSSGIHATSATRAVMWEGEKAREVGTLGTGTYSEATAINNKGQIVGISSTDGNDYSQSLHAFLWDKGRMIDLTSGYSNRSFAADINDSGTIVGNVQVPGDFDQAVYWENGKLNYLNMKGHATSVNNKKQIVGWMIVDFNSRGFLWDNGKVTDLGADVLPQKINDRGQIVGSRGINDEYHAFTTDQNSIISVTDLMGNYSVINGINEHGTMAGFSYDKNGSPYGYLIFNK